MKKSLIIWVGVVALVAAVAIFVVPRYLVYVSNRTQEINAQQARSVAAETQFCKPSDITVSKLKGSNESGYARVVGIVKNGCAEQTGVQLKFTAYGKDGELVKVDDFWPASVSNIPAGSDFPFEWVGHAESFDTFTVNVIEVKRW